jgi:hypothetical protein
VRSHEESVVVRNVRKTWLSTRRREERAVVMKVWSQRVSVWFAQETLEEGQEGYISHAQSNGRYRVT